MRESRCMSAVVKSLRPHQWAKNVLVFVPLLAAHRFDDWIAWRDALLTFAAFCACASAIYIHNDISDVAADRLHARKRHRPFAAGDLSVVTGRMMVAGLLLVGVGIAAAVSGGVIATLAVYVLLSIAYSLSLKRQPVVDVFILATFYVLRLVDGGVGTNTALSCWFL